MGGRIRDWTYQHYLLIGYLAIFVALLVTLIELRNAIHEQKRISADTNRIVKTEIPKLEKQLADATYIITLQAVPAITRMSAQLKAAGLEPPLVLLSPTCPPFVEQQVNPC